MDVKLIIYFDAEQRIASKLENHVYFLVYCTKLLMYPPNGENMYFEEKKNIKQQNSPAGIGNFLLSDVEVGSKKEASWRTSSLSWYGRISLRDAFDAYWETVASG